MKSSLDERIRADIAANGPLTVAAFMERALYDPDDGYYTGAAQRSGRGGDFFTSVDVGPLFGALLAAFVVRAWERWREDAHAPQRFDVVEAGAANGRLMRDVLDALADEHPACYADARVHLVERSAPARAAQAHTLGPHAPMVVTAADRLPDGLEGVLYANELLDAFPAHRLRMTAEGLRETHVTVRDGALALEDREVSTPALAGYFDALGVTLPPGGVADVSPAAIAWVAAAARRFKRGAMLFVDYGHEARELFAGPHLEGTLVSFARHQLDPAARGSGSTPAWLQAPGTRDLTTHVDFTSVTRAAEAEGCRRVALLGQGLFLLRLGLAERLAGAQGRGVRDVRQRLAAKSLITPGGLGASHRALVLAKGMPLEI